MIAIAKSLPVVEREFILLYWDECRDAWEQADQCEAASVWDAARLFRATRPGLVKHNTCRVVDRSTAARLWEGMAVEEEDLLCV